MERKIRKEEKSKKEEKSGTRKVWDIFMRLQSAGIIFAMGMTLYACPVYAANPVSVGSAAELVSSVAEQSHREEGLRTESIKEVVSTPIGAAALLESEKTAEEYKAAAMEAEGALWGYTNLGISNVDDNLNIRKTPGEDGRMVGKLPKNAACELISEEGEWTYIRSGKVEGYVKSEYLLSGWNAKKRALEEVSTVAVVDTTTLKVREQPNTECEVITMVPRERNWRWLR